MIDEMKGRKEELGVVRMWMGGGMGGGGEIEIYGEEGVKVMVKGVRGGNEKEGD